jgi:hypothetical protein
MTIRFVSPELAEAAVADPEVAAPAAVTGADIGEGAGAIAAGLGAMGLNLSTICHAWPVGARQHPAFLSIVQTGGSRSSLCCFLGWVRVDQGVWRVLCFKTRKKSILNLELVDVRRFEP